VSVAELFQVLREHPSGHVYTASPIEGSSDVYLAVSLAGQPCLFVKTEGRSPEPPLRTAKLSLRLSQEFILDLGSGPGRQLLHCLSCESTDRVDIDTFLVLVDAFLSRSRSLGIEGAQLSAFFRSLVRLFSIGAARDLQAERQGLWGELFMMRQVRGFGFWIPYWHSEATRAFDFSSSYNRVEVKTTTAAQRIHQFSHRQIYALTGEEIVIASILLREDDAGLSLRDLISECRSELIGTPDFLKLESAVRRAGMEDPELQGSVYDSNLARDSLSWFRSEDAPHFRMPEPAGVSETRYKVDLSSAPTLSADQLAIWLAAWEPISTGLTSAPRHA